MNDTSEVRRKTWFSFASTQPEEHLLVESALSLSISKIPVSLGFLIFIYFIFSFSFYHCGSDLFKFHICINQPVSSSFNDKA